MGQGLRRIGLGLRRIGLGLKDDYGWSIILGLYMHGTTGHC